MFYSTLEIVINNTTVVLSQLHNAYLANSFVRFVQRIESSNTHDYVVDFFVIVFFVSLSDKPYDKEAQKFKCKDGKHILNVWVCDNEKDCSDGEDEEPELCSKFSDFFFLAQMVIEIQRMHFSRFCRQPNVQTRPICVRKQK